MGEPTARQPPAVRQPPRAPPGDVDLGRLSLTLNRRRKRRGLAEVQDAIKAAVAANPEEENNRQEQQRKGGKDVQKEAHVVSPHLTMIVAFRR